MRDFSDSKIYELRSPSHPEIKPYVGSTTETLTRRIYMHNYNYKEFQNGKYHYVSSFEVVKFGDAVITLLEAYSCNTKEELLKKEQEWIDKTDCINIQNAVADPNYEKEYNRTHPEVVSKKNKKFYYANKDLCAEYHKDFLEKNPNYFKEYKEKNYEYLHTSIDCECGGKYVPNHKARHAETGLHKSYVNSQTNKS